MKVALLFYGQPRYVDNEDVYNSYKNSIIDKYDTDVFCHTWWSEDGGEYDYSSWSKISNCPILHNAREIICEKYNPLILVHNKPKTFELPPKAKEFIDFKFTDKHPDGNHWNPKNYSNVMSQLYSIKSVADIFDSYRNNSDVKETYDWIVLARYDTVLINFPNLEECDNSKFYLPGHHPRFPDTIHAFGIKYLAWAKNAFNDIEEIYSDIWEPSPEAFKYGSFMRRFNQNDLAPYPMDAHCVRG
jgi:hypothetical protein